MDNLDGGKIGGYLNECTYTEKDETLTAIILNRQAMIFWRVE